MSKDSFKEADEIEIEYEPEEESSSEEIPKEKRNLRTQAYDKSVSDLIQMIRKRDIILNPEYQRNYIWDNKKSSLLIESILLNIPIPTIYASEEEDGRWNIVDGLQRLFSLKRFYENNFRLTGLEVIQELNGLKYDDLNHKAKRILDGGNLRTILIFNDSHPEIKYDIFMRLNRGSVKLKEQELRNCLFRGTFNDMLKEIAKNSKLLNIMGLREPHKRMDDIELVLRYFAISDNYDIKSGTLKDYKGNMKTFLNAYMKEKQHMPEKVTEDMKTRFTNTIEKVYAVFNNKSFRRINADGEYDSPINRAILDFIMTSFEKYSYDHITSKNTGIVGLYRDIPATDRYFDESITTGTSDKKKVEYRITKWIEHMDAIMGS